MKSNARPMTIAAPFGRGSISARDHNKSNGHKQSGAKWPLWPAENTAPVYKTFFECIYHPRPCAGGSGVRKDPVSFGKGYRFAVSVTSKLDRLASNALPTSQHKLGFAPHKVEDKF